MEVVETQVGVGVFRAEGQVEGHVAAPGPGVFQQVQIIGNEETLAGREYAEVVGEDVGGAVAAAAEGAQRDPVGGRPADIGPRGEEPAVQRAVLQVYAADEGEGIFQREGIFPEARDGVLLAAVVVAGILIEGFGAVSDNGPEVLRVVAEHLIEVIVLPGGAQFDLVGLVDLVLVDEVGESGILLGIIILETEERIEFVAVEVGHQGDIGAVLLVEGEADLEIAVDAAVLDVGTPDPVLQVEGIVLGGVHLAAEAVVVEEAAAEADLHPARGVVEPAAGEVELQVFRLVAEAVLVVVHIRGGAAYVGHIDHTPLFVELDGRGDVGFVHPVGTAVELDEERGLVGGLAVFHIDLAGDGLQAVDHGRGAFGDLDAFEPLSGDERHSERAGDAPHHGAVFVEHLGVGA